MACDMRQLGWAIVTATLIAGCSSSTKTASHGSDKPAAPAKKEAPAEPTQPEFAASSSQVSPSDNPTVIRPTASRISLWGELPGSSNAAPTDASDNLRQVSFTREGSDFDVDIDPTGRQLVFASTRHRPTADLYVKTVDGQTTTQLTADAASDVMPKFSPDGKSIAFASNRAGNWDIYIKRLDGGQPIQVTNDPAQELHPSWSPDGSQLVFSAMGSNSGQWEMVVIDIDQPAKRKFIGFGLFPSFSPDGEKIAFQRARFRGTRTFSIWTVDFENGEGKRPTEIAAATNAAVINPAWSADGKRLAFTTVVNPPSDPSERPRVADLWAINLDGTGRVKLTNDKYANTQPVWSSNGRLYFISNRNGHDNIWSLRPSSGNMMVRQNNETDESTPTATVPTE